MWSGRASLKWENPLSYFKSISVFIFSSSAFLLFAFKMLQGKPPVPDTPSQSQIGGEASTGRLNYTGETRNSSSAEAAWTPTRGTRWCESLQSGRLDPSWPGSRNEPGMWTKRWSEPDLQGLNDEGWGFWLRRHYSCVYSVLTDQNQL